LLSKGSPIRRLTRELFEDGAGEDPFEFFPDLNFEFDKNGTNPLKFSGRVRFFKQQTLSIQRTQEHNAAWGNMMASVLFFGLSDLHWRNIALGTNLDNKPLVFPIDIEVVFDKLQMLSNSYLVDSIRNDQRITGTKQLRKNNADVAIVSESFIRSISFLNQHQNKVRDVLNKLPIQQVPIRRVLKRTRDYIAYLNGDLIAEELFPEELTQLERGDVPYFYSYFGNNELFYLPKRIRQRNSDIAS